MKHFTLRLSDDDYDLFMQIAVLERSSLAGAFRRSMMRAAHMHGLRTVENADNPVTRNVAAPVLSVARPPVQTIAPSAAKAVDSLFADDDETTDTTDYDAQERERRAFEEGNAPDDVYD